MCVQFTNVRGKANIPHMHSLHLISKFYSAEFLLRVTGKLRIT